MLLGRLLGMCSPYWADVGHFQLIEPTFGPILILMGQAMALLYILGPKLGLISAF